MSKSPNCRRLFKIFPVTILCFGSLPSLRRLLTTCSTQHSTVRRTPSTVRTIPAHPSLLVYLGLHPTPPHSHPLPHPLSWYPLISTLLHPSGIPNSPPPLNWYLALSTFPSSTLNCPLYSIPLAFLTPHPTPPHSTGISHSPPPPWHHSVLLCYDTGKEIMSENAKFVPEAP